MRLAWLLLAIPGVYAQSYFDPIKNFAISLGPENINLILTFWISYLILNYAIKLTPIFGSDSTHNQGGAIAAAMAAAATYFVYITKFNFIGSIMPFIVFLVVGALLLLISKLFGKTGGFKPGRLIITGILMILISLTLMGSTSLYTTAILGSTLYWLPETIFAIGMVLIMLGGVMTLKAPTGDSKITDSDILKAAGKPVGWLWSKTGGKLWNRFRGTPEEAPDIPSTTTTTPAEQTPNHENTDLTDGVVVAHEANIFPQIKEASKIIKSIIEEFQHESEDFEKEIEEVEELGKLFEQLSKQSRICYYLAAVAKTDSEDLLNILATINDFENKWSAQDDLGLAEKQKLVKEHEAIITSFNMHNAHKKKLSHDDIKKKLHPSIISDFFDNDFVNSVKDLMISTRFSNSGNNQLSFNELISESKDLTDILQILGEQLFKMDSIDTELRNKTIKISNKGGKIAEINSKIKSQISKLLVLAHAAESQARTISHVENRVIDADYNIIQGKHKLHNDNNFVQNTDKNSLGYGSWSYSEGKQPKRLVDRR